MRDEAMVRGDSEGFLWLFSLTGMAVAKHSRFFPSRRTMSGRASRTPSALSFADYGRDFYRSKSALRQRAEIMPTLRTPRLPLAISRKCGY